MTTIELGTIANPAIGKIIPATFDTIVSDLLDIIRSQTKQAGKDWSAATTMQETGIDSFDFVELIYEVEDKYGIDLNFNANTAEDVQTVADVASLIKARLATKQTS